MPILNDKDLVQVDATVIAGVLILLTLSSVGTEPSANQYNLFKNLFTLITIVPFALSAILILRGNFAKKAPKNYLTQASRFTLSGFIYIPATIATLIVLSYLTR